MKNNIAKLILLFMIVSAITIPTFLLILEREESKINIESLKTEIRIKEKKHNSTIESYKSIINENQATIDSLFEENSSIPIQGFSINNRSISVEELLRIVNKTIEENSNLKNQVDNDKMILEFIETKHGIKVSKDNKGQFYITKKPDSKVNELEKTVNDKVSTLNDELQEKDFILKQLQKRYGFKYEVKTEGNKIKSTIYTTKLDSALWLYPHYKHKFRTDKEGNLIVK